MLARRRGGHWLPTRGDAEGEGTLQSGASGQEISGEGEAGNQDCKSGAAHEGLPLISSQTTLYFCAFVFKISIHLK